MRPISEASGDLTARAQAAAAVAAAHADDVDVDARFPAEAFAEIKSQRLLGIMVPTDLGGEGGSLGDVVDICYLLGQACASTGLTYAMHQVKVGCLLRHGQGSAAIEGILRRLSAEQLLLASSTTEGKGGGNIRSSEAPVERKGNRISLERQATVISYGANADGLVTTARRAADAAASDQVLVVFLKSDYTLEPLLGWDTLGMRGTCSRGFTLKATGDADQILPEPYERIHARTMVPFAHLTWSAVWARIAPLPAPQDIYIRCRGGLTMVPVSDPAEYPASIDDARLQLTGRPVRLHDARRQTDATCDRLLYHARDRKLELIGSPDFPLRFDSPRGRGGGRLFWLRDTPGGATGGFEGSGWLTAANETPDRPPSPVAEAAFPPPWPNTPPPRPVAPVEADGKPAEAATPLERLRIVWEKGVDLEFDEPDQPGGTTHLRRARFDGNVRVHSEEGTIACDDLDLRLMTNDEGKSIPTTMTATGQVRAADPERTIWADVLVVEFRERRAAAAEPDEEGAYRDPMGGDAEVERMTAEGDVQVLLANGARAFAQKLIGDVPGETIELLGSNVVIAYDKMIIDRGRRVVLRRQTDTAHWDGPGQARFFSTPLETAAEGRIERPDVIGEPDVRARWNTSMLYDNTFNEGAGSIDLRGEVDAKSEPSPLERNTVNADALTLEFVNVPRADGGDEGHPPPAGATLSPDNVERVLGRFIARGEAKLENRTWLTAEHVDKPRVFYIAGEHVEYDDQTGEALVVGAGELLIRDLTEDDAAGGSAPFGPKGTTLFRWKKKLHMTRGLDDRFDIVMAGEVEALHQGLDDETATLSCDRLEATVVRPGATGKRGALDLEGPAKLKRLRAWDGVFIRTQTRDVDCDEFDYNATTGLAQVRARPGRRVSILTRGTAHPIHAQHALWNMSNDRVTITGGSGADSN